MRAQDILKQAILLEQRGRSFYSRIAESTALADVKSIFLLMADEEEKHAAWLSEQYKSFNEKKEFLPLQSKEKPGTISAGVMTKAIKEQINAAGFEAAAIAAAMAWSRKRYSFIPPGRRKPWTAMKRPSTSCWRTGKKRTSISWFP
ncbi:MAG: hypothetical protein E4H36_07690 [Spirochaetales bacterium]|nr:MAG: hypothetical protein E4H36_07690 [Spirochaetales bacterium]